MRSEGGDGWTDTGPTRCLFEPRKGVEQNEVVESVEGWTQGRETGNVQGRCFPARYWIPQETPKPARTTVQLPTSRFEAGR